MPDAHGTEKSLALGMEEQETNIETKGRDVGKENTVTEEELVIGRKEPKYKI